jgi:opacity protein-like surface antigen
MRSIFSFAILAAALTTACSSADSVAPAITPATARLTAPADANTATDKWQPVDQYVWLSCANGGVGETVHVTGDLRYSIHTNQDGSGTTHINIKSNTSGLTGIGLTTNTSFRGMMAEHVNSRGEDELNMDVKTSDMVRLVARGGVSYSLLVTSRLILDDGDYVVAEQSWKEVCRD